MSLDPVVLNESVKSAPPASVSSIAVLPFGVLMKQCPLVSSQGVGVANLVVAAVTEPFAFKDRQET